MAAETSTRNPERDMEFQVSSASVFKQSVSVVSGDLGLSMARLDITPDNGFEITVRDSQTQTAAHLLLNISELLNFRCTKPIDGMMISLSRFRHVLGNSENDDDTVTLSHAQDSTHLSLTFESEPTTEYKISLYTMPEGPDYIDKFPDTTFYSEARFASSILRELIEELEQKGKPDDIVVVEITEARVTVYIDYIEDLSPWFANYVTENDESEVITPGQTHYAWFRLSHWGLVKTASHVGNFFTMCLCYEPEHNIMMRFELGGGFGVFEFLNKAIRVHPHYEETAELLKLLLFNQ